MKKFLLTTVALATLAAVAPALAADLGARPYPYAKAPPAYAAPIYNWTGFYLGGHLGGAFTSDNNFSGLATGNNRFLGGVQGGADWQFAPTWVIGAEAQYSWISGNVGAVFPGGFAYTNKQRGLGSVTGRVGYTWGPGLLYVKGGYAFSDNNESVTLGGAPVAFATTGDHSNGYTVGAGVEYLFAPNWSAKAEYQYYNFGKATFTAPAALVPFGSFTTDDHVIKAGINYRFNWGGPVVARY
ncbi:outer membrane beta-barrel protein [Bradyrhizobium sp.]|uniref:outer membrane protein n=1 Tax=Bradyrhizobium sp. TaxID=376 RepID=UPI001ECBCDD3|nr:outer membrane beta-barrel protein [Bradyrhizobium sp.]MBV9984835.1 porin family protein [Bradyrhizobium sp.]